MLTASQYGAVMWRCCPSWNLRIRRFTRMRLYCTVPSILFWGFFFAAGVHSVRLAARAPDRPLHAAAGLVVLAFLLFALTDNPMVCTAHFMTPLAIVLGLSDGTYQRERGNGRRHATRAAARPGP
jgi:hypothetical protein